MIKRRLFLSYGHYVQQADAGHPEDWVVLRLLCATARQVLRASLPDPALPDELTVAAHAALEALRGYPSAAGDNWAAVQAVARAVVPVVVRVLDCTGPRTRPA